MTVLLLHRDATFLESVRPMTRDLPGPLLEHSLDEPLDPVLVSETPRLALLDFASGHRDAVEAISTLRERAPGCAVLAVVEPEGATKAVGLMNSGVDDYVLGPPRHRDFIARCRRILDNHDLRRRLDLLQVELNRRYGAHRIVCRSSAMQAVYQRVLQLAPTRTTVLVSGESGSGKELIARSLHYNSDRRDQPFIAMNCAAVPQTLIENELFGHERGAYTGADARVAGKFELASGGTLFLDEVGSMDLATQARLLRVLEEGEFMRVGGARTIKVDVRLVAATNVDLEQGVRDREFRQDLLYRLKVATIDVPPLRKRRDDIPPLARTFARQVSEENGLTPVDLAPETLQLLARHDWPGNVRELKNLLESLVVTAGTELLQPEHLPKSIGRPTTAAASSLPAPGMTLEDLERLYVEATLKATEGNRTQAAKMLGIGLRTLQRKLKRHEIDLPPGSGAGS
ncbi:MAG: sigma-54 dependent transcriptional regulator [Acidobacteriota bacterium]